MDLVTQLEASLSGIYTIERELEGGGMSRVFVAAESALGRSVVLKLLPSELTTGVSTERFRREIQLAAALHHPHIVPVLSAGDAGGLLYYTMPLVDGESLRALLARDGALPASRAVPILRDIAKALAHAHGKGIVHRDIKPDNVLLSGNAASVTDFGIAKAVRAARGSDPALTQTGTSLGTPMYMAPEQAAGDPATDHRADLYAFGCVAYEMMAGRPPFVGLTPHALIAAHMRDRPESLQDHAPQTPVQLVELVMRCLEKSPERRPASAEEILEVLEPLGSFVVRRRPLSRTHWLWGGTAAVVTVAAGLLLRANVAGPKPSMSDTRRQLTFTGSAFRPAISPDGRLLAYAVEHAPDVYSIFVQDLSSGRTDSLAETRVYTLEWSPDGTRLLIGGSNEVRVIPRGSGAERRVSGTLCAARAHWLPDGRRVSRHCSLGRGGITIVDLETEDSTVVPLAGHRGGMHGGSWSPDGRRFAFANNSLDPVQWTIRVVENGGDAVIAVEDSVPLASPRWARDGRGLYFTRDYAEVWYVSVSPRDGRAGKAAELLHAQMDVPMGLGGTYSGVGGEQFSLTRDETRMVYTKGSRSSNLWLLEMSESGAPPRTRQLTTGTALRWSPVVSPDGRWIAFAQESHGRTELFRMPIDGREASQITLGARVWRQGRIAWSPDGSRIAFVSVRGGKANVWVATIDGGRLQRFAVTRVHPGSGHIAWAPGKLIAYQPSPHSNIRLLEPSDGSERTLIARDSGFFFSPAYSPDGNQLAVNWTRTLDDASPYVFDLRDGSYRKLRGSWRPAGWSADSRFVYVASEDAVFRSDARADRPQELVFRAPFRDAQCTAVGSGRSMRFVCAAFESKSDIWMLENFASRAK